MTLQTQRDLPRHDDELVQMTAQLPCYEYYSAPRSPMDEPARPAPAPSVAVLEQMFGYFG